ncbi:MAG TPA: hypothetical protein VK209_12715 [Candidatus Sulfotelmatobacter sp.]|nr:hypothetical protein [Candidatus Sulfotelmatobacter sp.]
MNRPTKLLGIALLTILLANFSAVLVYAFPDDTIREKTFTTYLVEPIGTPGTDSYNAYAYSDIHWPSGTANIAYSVNLKGAPTGAITEISEAFETWDAQIGDKLFKDTVGTTSRAGNKFDSYNVVSWARLGRGIIAQTTVWYNRNTKEIVEFGMVFSTAYKWGVDTDGEDTTYTLTNAFDVRNIATHEAGHTLMLDDLYMTDASKLTMYGYGDFGETYAISLGAGDITGIKAIYP